MRLTVLVENEPQRGSPVGGEHGLAILVEAVGRYALFDTGASDLVVRNAEALGLAGALAGIEAVVLSHGHYDHTGGLAAVLGLARKPLPVHVGPGFFAERFSGSRKIGLPLPREEYERLGAVFVETAAPREVLPGLRTVGGIPLDFEREAGEPSLMIQTACGEVTRDRFEDETVLVAETPRGAVVLAGCSHRGVVNAALASATGAGGMEIAALAGGAHMRDFDRGRIERSLGRLGELGVGTLALGHCTGAEAERIAAKMFGGSFRPLRAGDELRF